MIFFSNSKKSTFTLNDQVFEGKYENNKGFIKIDNLKLMGYNKTGIPYQLTADSAVKKKKVLMKLYYIKLKLIFLLKIRIGYF